MTNTPTMDRVMEAAREPVRHRRNRLAEDFAFALVGNPNWNKNVLMTMVDAVTLANALIEELDK